MGPYERKVGGADGTEAVTKHYYALGKLLAVRKNGTLSYLGTDQLGSPIRVADASFSPVDRMRYTPFGNSRDTGTGLPTDRRFTGQTQDASVGLHWYGSRAYDPAIGRFTSPDSIVPGAGNPQGLNRYSYVLNNPTKYSDPTGHRTYFIGGTGGSGAKEFGAFVDELSKAGVPDVNPPVKAFDDFTEPWNWAEAVGKVLLSPILDWDAQALATAIRLDPPGQGEQLNIIGLSGGAAVAFNAAQILSPIGSQVAISSIVTLGGFVNRFAPLPNVGAWTAFESLGDLISLTGWFPTNPIPMPYITEEGVITNNPATHLDYVGNKYQRKYVIDKLLKNGIGSSVAHALSFGDYSASAAMPASGVGSIPADVAAGGVGVENITASNPSGSPAGGESWVSPGGTDAQADAAARRAAWERGGSLDYNALHAEGVPGY